MADRARSSIVIDAAPADVMAVIGDFAAYPTWSPQVKRVEVLATDDQGRGVEARFQLDAGVVKDEYVLTYDWSTPGSVSWHLTSGQMQKRQEGSYVLRPVGSGPGPRTEVTYDLTVELAIPMLGLFKRKAEKLIIDTALRGLKRHVEAA
jgi:hypothetical protein